MNDLETSDFTLCSVLHALGFKIEHTFRGNGGKVIFCFKNDAHLASIIEKYERGELCIEPQKFASSQRFLKTIIHSK